jgi:hypothetical protein
LEEWNIERMGKNSDGVMGRRGDGVEKLFVSPLLRVFVSPNLAFASQYSIIPTFHCSF